MQLRIFHTNDIHSDYAFLKWVHRYLAENRRENDLYLDSGDYTDLKNIIVQADRGEMALQLFASCGLDAMALGNNEIDLGSEDLKKLSAVPLLSANVTQNDGTLIPGIRSYIILEREHVRFLIIGLSPWYANDLTPNKYNLFFEMGNVSTNDPIPALRRVLEAQKGNYDFAICLSHSGHYVDRYLQKFFPEIDLWLGGHAHAVITETDYSSSGKGSALGELVLDISRVHPKVISSRQIIPEDTENADFSLALSEAESRANAILSAELNAVGELEFDPFTESPLTNYICDCLKAHFGGDLALMHSGISEKALQRPISRKSLIETFPSKLNPTIYKISGKKLLEAIQLSMDGTHIRQSGKGAGFRGSVLGTLGFSANVQIVTEPFDVTIDAEPINLDKYYSIVTDDYLQRGTGYPSLAVPDEEASFDKWFIRDLVEHYLENEAVYQSAFIRRMRYL